MSWQYDVLAIVFLWLLAGFLVMLGYNAFKAMKAAHDAPEPTVEMELAANWRVIRALDTVYDELCTWEHTLLDDESPEVSSVIIARRVITDLRDMKAAL